MKDELQKLYALIDDIEIAMMTTRRRDGHMQARAMATQKPAAGADLWFVTYEGAAKLVDLEFDDHLNLAFYRGGNRQWISVSGTGVVSRDRAKIRELYAADWKIWFADEGDPWHGTAEDPRMILIGVTIHAAVFLEVNKPRPVLLYEFVKGWMRGTQPEFGETHKLEEPHRPNS